MTLRNFKLVVLRDIAVSFNNAEFPTLQIAVMAQLAAGVKDFEFVTLCAVYIFYGVWVDRENARAP